MMRFFHILAVVRLLFAALSVGAASVTPASSTKYIFTTPLFPDTIHGEVMGAPPAYLTVRGEDIDWLFEAHEERIALINGRMPSHTTHLKPSFGEWDLSETNRFYKWASAVDASGTTNVVVGYNLVTNAPRFSIDSQDVKAAYNMMSYVFYNQKLGYETGSGSAYRSSYLDGSAALSTNAARLAYVYSDVPSFTNVHSSVVITNSSVTEVSYIVMPLTNGTTSVFTNSWTATFRHLVTNSVTNVVVATPLDYCHTAEGSFPGFPNATALDLRIYATHRDGDVAIFYDALRAAVRLSDTTTPTNRAKCVRQSLTRYPGEATYYRSTTNFYTYAEYNVSCDHDYYIEHDDFNNPYRVPYFYNSELQTLTYEAIAPTRFQTDLVTTGGFVRVEIEAAFAVVELQYQKDHLEGPIENPDLVLDEAIDKIVVAPLSIHSIDLSHKNVLARVQIDAKALLFASYSAAGAPAPPENYEYTPPAYERHFWSAKCDQIVLIYKIKPSSKFSSW